MHKDSMSKFIDTSHKLSSILYHIPKQNPMSGRQKENHRMLLFVHFTYQSPLGKGFH